MDVFFTLNAGPGPRDVNRALIEVAAERQDPIAVWELANEINAFQVVHGLGFRISGEQYADDLKTARALVDELMPDALLAGPSSAYWPELGEVFPVQEDALRQGGDALDLTTWHYYPQQSRRCPIASRQASVGVTMNPVAPDEIDQWADEVEEIRNMYAPGAPVWLGESGSAQCGGEPGVSDVFASGFWWLDHCARDRSGAIVVMIVNVDQDAGLFMTLDAPVGREAEVYRFTARRQATAFSCSRRRRSQPVAERNRAFRRPTVSSSLRSKSRS